MLAMQPEDCLVVMADHRVSIATVLLDYLIFGNQLPISMILIIMGIIIIFYKPK